MRDEAGDDDKILSVPATDPRWSHLLDITDIASFLLDEILHFFQVYKQLEPGKLDRARPLGGPRRRGGDDRDRVSTRSSLTPGGGSLQVKLGRKGMPLRPSVDFVASTWWISIWLASKPIADAAM